MIDWSRKSVMRTHQLVSESSGKRRHISVRGIGKQYASVGVVSYGGRELATTDAYPFPQAALVAAAELANSL